MADRLRQGRRSLRLRKTVSGAGGGANSLAGRSNKFRAQNVAGCASTSPLGGANWPGKYAGRYSDADAGKRDSPDATGPDTERVIGAPPESVDWRLCSIDALERLGDAVSRGCSSITVTNPSTAIKAATFTVVFKRLLLV